MKRITRIALLNRWIEIDPFIGIKYSQTKSNREFLSEQELMRIIQKDISIERLEVVRDIFVFCSFTGLAFTDVKHLKPQHIHFDDNHPSNAGNVYKNVIRSLLFAPGKDLLRVVFAQMEVKQYQQPIAILPE